MEKRENMEVIRFPPEVNSPGGSSEVPPVEKASLSPDLHLKGYGQKVCPQYDKKEAFRLAMAKQLAMSPLRALPQGFHFALKDQGVARDWQNLWYAPVFLPPQRYAKVILHRMQHSANVSLKSMLYKRFLSLLKLMCTPFKLSACILELGRNFVGAAHGLIKLLQ